MFGVLLDKKQLEKYMEKLACDHNLKPESEEKTYPIPSLEKDFEYITMVYNLLNEHIKLGIDIHPAGEWLLDNYYIIEERVKQIKDELTLTKYKKFLGLDNGQYAGYARIYILAKEMCTYTDSNINKENLEFMLTSYQRRKTLNMDEIWNIELFIKIVIIENIKDICEKIYASQMQKYRVENIIERLVEQKNKDVQKFNKKQYKSYKFGYGEMKYPFIEYMSYKLKKTDKDNYEYIEALEDAVEKMGTNINDVIKKEHFGIAIKKVLMGNCITTLKNISRIDFQEIFERINGVEEILKMDPAEVYNKMDYKTKAYYRGKIKELAKKTKISEVYIARKIVELSTGKQGKKSHIGYYLIDEGKFDLYKEIKYKPINMKNETKLNLLIAFTWGATLLISILIGKLYNNYILSVLGILPIHEIINQFTQYIFSKIVKPKLLPKIDMQNTIAKEQATMVVIPTIVDSKEKVEEMFRKLEVYFLANKSDNLYFTLLGDCKPSKIERRTQDKEIAITGIKLVNELNKKYNKEIFNFLYRKRKWNEGENEYLGWERKRGLLMQFNSFLINRSEEDFALNTINNMKEIPNIKYIITLDSDTNLILNSAFELIGTMEHILNKPVLKDGIVVEGHGIIQPKVGINLDEAEKSWFSKIFAGSPGTDIYTNAISDFYQDNFNEGIFTGKGIYELNTFYRVLKDAIPEYTVLSHDLLEGSYLRAGLATDILLMDGYPSKFIAFMTRLGRWVRGDWQICNWIFKYIKNSKEETIKNPINKLSKYKILDNLRRSIIGLFILILLLVGIYTNKFGIILISIMAITINLILEGINKIIYRKDGEKFKKSFVKTVNGWKGIIIKFILDIGFFPTKTYVETKAIIQALYRKYVSKKKILEWTTAEEAELSKDNDLDSYVGYMFINLVLAVLINAFTMNYIAIVIGLLWLISPIISFKISKPIPEKDPLKKIDKKHQKYIVNIAHKTWEFFKDYLMEENNYLPPDNYQENRKEKIVERTSSTNIGLAMVSVISAYDMGFENIYSSVSLLQKMLDTVEKLEKWNGHLYNWYNIKTLAPLEPRYVSTVDSGNFVGYLYVVKQFLKEHIRLYENVEDYILLVDRIITNTNFSLLYDNSSRLFSIGFDVSTNKLTDSYYDLLASEARQASFIAIAKKDVPVKHWACLNRTLTAMDGYKGLISWSGTAFEYLMPNINMKSYHGSLLDESCKFMIMSQIKYSEKLNIPWGISESAFNLKDLKSNYQYKAFGIPWLGLKRGLGDEMVISSYGTVLAICDYPREVLENIERLEKEGAFGKYGLYEAIDYTKSRLKKNEKNEVVQTFMAHHQALILISINNFFHKNIVQKRFSKNPEIEGTEILLQERMPEDIIITKEKKEVPEKLKYKDYESYYRVELDNVEKQERCNVISNQEYSILMNAKGNGYSKINNIYINRYKSTDENLQGINFFIRNINTNKIWTSNYYKDIVKPSKYKAIFKPDSNTIERTDGNIETTIDVTVSQNEPTEIRKIEFNNIGNEDEIIEVTGCFEPIISDINADIAHKAFNNLFLRYDFNKENQTLIIERRKRDEHSEGIFLGVNFYTENETMGELEYEIDAQKFNNFNDMNFPKTIKEGKRFSNSIGLVTEPIVAIKRILKIPAHKSAELYFIISVAKEKEELVMNIEKIKNQEAVRNIFEISKAKAIEEARYLQIKGNELAEYQKLISLLINPSYVSWYYKNKVKDANFKKSDLWKFGVSGDFPILMLKLKNINDMYLLNELLKLYEILRIKNIPIEFIILSEEEYLVEYINSAILNAHLEYMKNVRCGIFVMAASNFTQEENNLFLFVSNLIIDANLGNINYQLNKIKKLYNKQRKEIINPLEEVEIKQNEKIRTPNLEKIDSSKNLKYYNEYGAFAKNGKEYYIKTNKDILLPTVWSNVLANKNFGTLVTDGAGGYTWSKNSRLNRITAFTNYASKDIPSEIIYFINNENKRFWTIGNRAVEDNNDYYVTYGFGYAKYNHTADGIVQTDEVFVPKDDKVKVNLINVKNTTDKQKKISIFYYLKPVLGEDELQTNGKIEVKLNKNIIYAINKMDELTNETTFVSSSLEINSYTGSKSSFIGNSTIKKPVALFTNNLDNSSGIGENSCIAVKMNIELKPYEAKDISIILGEEQSNNINSIVEKYTNIENCKKILEETKEYWKNIVNTIQVETPMESMNILLNGWLVYQTIASRLLGKTGYYQSGGAIGFRDQLQDALNMKYIDINILKNQIIKNSQHQFIEGDVEHWWHDINKMGIRTKFSDDLLWLPYAVLEYIKITEDREILNIETNYIEGKTLKEDELERYSLRNFSEFKGTIYEHCKKAIERACNFGANGLPKIGSGDWNDGFSNIGPKGEGESVWLAFFLYDILNKWVNEIKIDEDEKYIEILEDLKRNINKNAWDGKWFKRAFMDDGTPIGSMENDECRIDGISQSWGVISGAADNDKKFISMNSLETHLIDKENGLIKLLDPPFENGRIEPGYIKSYLPGVRENGGQYTHGAVWAIIAETLLGFGDKAVEMFKIINPIEHTRTKESTNKYKVEPYVLSADVYSSKNLAGRGGWTWYTGSSGWLYTAGIEYILGLKISNNYLSINPCISKDWKEYKINYKYKSTIYHINVKNPEGKNTGVTKVYCNGNEVFEKKIKLIDDGEIYNIEVIM